MDRLTRNDPSGTLGLDSTYVLANGAEMPVLGLGTWRTEGDDAMLDAVSAAREAGYRHFDTARSYKNQANLGAALKRLSIPRDTIWITTKLSNPDQRMHVQREAFEQSLADLGTDHVDLLLVHWPVPECWHETWRVLEEIYTSGAARAIGVANFLPHHLDEFASFATTMPMVDQYEHHPLIGRPAQRELCDSRCIQREAYSPLGGRGSLLLDDPRIAAIAAKHAVSCAQVMLRWSLQEGFVVIPKSTHPERVRQNADVFGFELDAEDVAAIDAMDEDRWFCGDPDNIGTGDVVHKD